MKHSSNWSGTQKADGTYVLPAHWPPYATQEYYSWKMARMPKGAIPADWSKHKPHNSYDPLFWYEDQARECVDCGKSFVFTKEEQKHWYEKLQFPIYVEGTRCSDCSGRRHKAKADQKAHMEKMSMREAHPNDDFFKKRWV